MPACRRHGLGIIPWSPLAGGFLTGKYAKDAKPPAGSRLEKWKQRYEGFDKPRNWRVLEVLLAVADEVGASPAQVALAWLLQRPAVTSVIFGARSIDQLDDNLKAAALELPAAALAGLDAASEFDLGYPYGMLKRVQGRW